MPAAMLSHPDRLATTLANLAALRTERPDASPSHNPGASDCRIDLKQMQWRALRAADRSEPARQHLAKFLPEQYPELWQGTVQDGVARGFYAHLEEVASLGAMPEVQDPHEQPFEPEPGTKVAEFTGKDLRRKKDILVASGGPRIRFSRKGGVLFVDRDQDINSQNCLWFEARQDHGTLDEFVAQADERPRLFSAQFLKPKRFVQSKHYSQLELEGRLGRGPIGWPCRLVITGRSGAPQLRMTIELAQTCIGWRLRSRFLGVPASLLHHHCMPVREVVTSSTGGFVADTMIRSCATLLVDGQPVAVPAASTVTALRHTFSLGNPTN